MGKSYIKTDGTRYCLLQAKIPEHEYNALRSLAFDLKLTMQTLIKRIVAGYLNKPKDRND